MSFTWHHTVVVIITHHHDKSTVLCQACENGSRITLKGSAGLSFQKHLCYRLAHGGQLLVPRDHGLGRQLSTGLIYLSSTGGFLQPSSVEWGKKGRGHRHQDTGGLTPWRPLSGLQEIPIATQEDIRILCFPSSRGLTHWVSLECVPVIPIAPGEEH